MESCHSLACKTVIAMYIHALIGKKRKIKKQEKKNIFQINERETFVRATNLNRTSPLCSKKSFNRL